MSSDLFVLRDYRDYLRAKLSGRGIKTQLSKFLGVQTAFISQVLSENNHFSFEHAVRLNEFLGHSKEESHFFMLLVQFGRAGSVQLQDYYRAELDEALSARDQVGKRLQSAQELEREAQLIYYSAWYYSAIHVMLSIPRFQKKAAIARHLDMPIRLVSECLDFLTSSGLAKTVGDTYLIGERRIHLSANSPLILHHHTHWRHHAIQSLMQTQKEDLHYSSVVSLSEKDAKEIRALLLATLEKSDQILAKSPEENLFSLSMDFYQIGSKSF